MTFVLFSPSKKCICLFDRWWKQPIGTGSYLNPALPLVRLMIISESSHGHLGASCSNIGRIRTKENIAVDTHLIGILAKPTWGLPDLI